MYIIFGVKLLFLFLIVSSIDCHKSIENPITITERDELISDFFYRYFRISIPVKLLWQLFYSIIGSILVGLSGILPLLVISPETGNYLRSKNGVTSLNRWLSFAFGSIMGEVFLHLLPEAFDSIAQSDFGDQSHIVLGSWILTGFFLFFVIERVFSLDQNHQKKTEKPIGNGKLLRKNGDTSRDSVEEDSSVIKTEGYLNLLANFTDNFTHGLAIGGSFLVSFKIGVLTTACILIHEIPHEVSDFVILLRAGFDRWKAAKLQLMTAGGSFLGAVFALTADSTTTGLSKTCILPFTAGAFLYIAMVSLLPSILAEMSSRESAIQFIFISLGFFIMVTMSQYCS